jgi:hypothetical protein
LPVPKDTGNGNPEQGVGGGVGAKDRILCQDSHKGSLALEH